MKLNLKLPAKYLNKLSRLKFKASKRSPEILLVTGILGLVGAGVTACVATTKLPEVKEEHKKEMEQVHQETESETEQRGKGVTTVYIHTTWRLVKLYGPSVVMAAGSIVSLVAGNNIHRKRGAALAAAYAALDKGYKTYRAGVVERFGEQVDQEIKYGLKPVEVEETVMDEKGKEKKVKRTTLVRTGDKTLASPYMAYFDEDSPYWESHFEYNKTFVITRQSVACDMLRARGCLTLNEARDMLGLKRVKIGQHMGWKYDPSDPNCDNFVDFGMKIVDAPDRKYGYAILLDFNVDTDLYESGFFGEE